MTVCIAAQFLLKPPYVKNAQPAFVLCTDGRLSGGALGAADRAIKAHAFGYNFMGLMAGHWSTVREACHQLEKDFKSFSVPPSEKAEAQIRVSESLEKFCLSPLCPKRSTCEIIITGFIGEEPVMFRVAIANRRATVLNSHDREEAGEGSFAARFMLSHRGYDAHNMDLPMACYLVYEAKRFSETVESVGPLTWLKVHSIGDGDPSDPNRTCWMDISQNGLAVLEIWRKKFFLQSAAELKGEHFAYFH